MRPCLTLVGALVCVAFAACGDDETAATDTGAADSTTADATTIDATESDTTASDTTAVDATARAVSRIGPVQPVQAVRAVQPPPRLPPVCPWRSLLRPLHLPL